MRNSSLIITVIVPATVVGVPALLQVRPAFAQDACAAGSGSGIARELKGNWYCSQVPAISYSNFPGHGFYNKVTAMNAATGQCENVKYAYNGSLSPLNEEVSGPYSFP